MTLRDPPDERDVATLLEFGVVNLDKPPGPSAHQVSAWVREMVGVERAAHAGTLDPKVTGCLPVLLDTATRAVPALQGQPKTYVAVLELHAAPPSDLDAVLASFVGRLYQKPPRKSAVARRLRVREVYNLTVLDRRDRQVLCRVECEGGTYVRKLCHDIGLALGTGAHMGDLRRVGSVPFDDADLVTLHDLSDALARLREDGDDEWLREVVHPAERALVHLPSVVVAPSAAEQVAHGAPVYAPGVIRLDGPQWPGGERESGAPVERGSLVACHTPDGAAVCLGRLVGDPDAETGTVVDLERVLV